MSIVKWAWNIRTVLLLLVPTSFLVWGALSYKDGVDRGRSEVWREIRRFTADAEVLKGKLTAAEGGVTVDRDVLDVLDMFGVSSGHIDLAVDESEISRVRSDLEGVVARSIELGSDASSIRIGALSRAARDARGLADSVGALRRRFDRMSRGFSERRELAAEFLRPVTDALRKDVHEFALVLAGASRAVTPNAAEKTSDLLCRTLRLALIVFGGEALSAKLDRLAESECDVPAMKGELRSISLGGGPLVFDREGVMSAMLDSLAVAGFVATKGSPYEVVDWLNLRTQPILADSTKVRVLAPGTIIRATEIEDGWLAVDPPDGPGFVSSSTQYVRPID